MFPLLPVLLMLLFPSSGFEGREAWSKPNSLGHWGRQLPAETREWVQWLAAEAAETSGPALKPSVDTETARAIDRIPSQPEIEPSQAHQECRRSRDGPYVR